MQLALGLIETKGLIGAIEAADAMVKTAHVKFVGRENVTGGLVIVKVVGEVAAVKSAVDAGASAAQRVGQLVTSHVIPRPDDQIDRMLFEDISAGNDISVRSVEKFLEDLLKIFDTGTETKKHPVKPQPPEPPRRPIRRPRVRKEEDPPKVNDELKDGNSFENNEVESRLEVDSTASTEVKAVDEPEVNKEIKQEEPRTETGERKPEAGEEKAESEKIEEPEQEEAQEPETEEVKAEAGKGDDGEQDEVEETGTGEEETEKAEEPEQRKPRGKSGRKKKQVSEVDDLFGGMYSEEVIPDAEEENEKPETEEEATETPADGTSPADGASGKAEAESENAGEMREEETVLEESESAETGKAEGESVEAEATEAEAEEAEEIEPEAEAETEESGKVEEPESEASSEDIPSREELESFNVHELRKLARSLDSFPIKGRDISKANRGALIEHFNSLR